MSQQGERCGHEDDWWRELYDADKADTGPGPAADSLDDRFYSAARTLDTRTDPPARRRPDAPPGRRDPGGGRVESGRPDPGRDRAESGRAESSRLESGRVHPGRPDPGRPDPGRIESCRAEPRHPGPDLPQRAAEEGEWWQSTPPALGRDRADSPPVAWPEPTWPEPAWPAPPRLSRPPKPRPPYEDSAGYAAGYAAGDPHGKPGVSTPDDFASDAVPLRESDDFASGLAPFRDPDDLAADAASLPEWDDFASDVASFRDPDDVAADAAPLRDPDDFAVDAASLRDPDARPPAEAEFVGERPPTYEGEPTALPFADPDGIGDLVPDTVLDGARYGSFALRTASLRGDSPRYRGEPRHDALVTARFGSSWEQDWWGCAPSPPR
ncbi:hypothetical protein AB0C51_24260 [Streptomyces pathocidini]|uniref:hypothetical protein n=1 Tax=Streptomyces pathocidini TaxID=1650571 RepID=UPI003409EEF0